MMDAKAQPQLVNYLLHCPLFFSLMTEGNNNKIAGRVIVATMKRDMKVEKGSAMKEE